MDVRDAGVNSLLGDVAVLLQVLTKQGGEPLIEHLVRNILPQLSLPGDLQVPIFLCKLMCSNLLGNI